MCTMCSYHEALANGIYAMIDMGDSLAVIHMCPVYFTVYRKTEPILLCQPPWIWIEDIFVCTYKAMELMKN